MYARMERLAAATVQKTEQFLRVMKGHVHWRNKIRTIYAHNAELKGAPSDRDLSKEAQDYYGRWGVRISPLWHQAFYQVSGRRDVRYLPDDIFHMRLETRLNRKDLARAYVDKNMLNKFLPTAHTPQTIVRNMSGQYLDRSYNLLSPKQAARSLQHSSGEFVIKPAIETAGGLNVRILTAKDSRLRLNGEGVSFEDLSSLYERDFIIQERLEQDPFLNSIYPHALNTLRVITLLFREQVHVLSTVLRMGNNGSYVDNYSAGGVCCGVGADGSLSSFAVDKAFRTFERHPESGFIFRGAHLSRYRQVEAFVGGLHKSFSPHFRLVSWDVGLARDGRPTLIELNIRNQQIDFHQIHNGPLLGAMTEDVLDEILN